MADNKENKVDLFEAKHPCGNCPYRTDAPLRLWDRCEYKMLLDREDDPIGAVYKCHKNNGSVCVGWLINQDRRGLPSIALRLSLREHDVAVEYLDSLSSPAPLYESLEKMVAANYPALLRGRRKKKNTLAELFSKHFPETQSDD